MEKTTEKVENGEPLESGDVPCASACNTEWQKCNEDSPGQTGACATKLAKCVKSCDSEAK